MINRRDAITLLASAASLPLLPGCGRDQPPAPAATNEAEAIAMLDRVADNLLALAPEGATSLGIDTGARVALRSRLTDRSAEGQQRVTGADRA